MILLEAFNVCNAYGKGRDIREKQQKISEALYVRMKDDWIGAIRSCLQRYVEIEAPNIVSETMMDEEGNRLLHLLSTKDLGAREVQVMVHGLGEMNDVEVFSFEPVTAHLSGDTICLKNFQTMVTLRIKG